MRHRVILFALLMIIVLVGGYLAGCASGSGQPHMNAALDELRSARSELDAAMTDKGGHRAAAIALVDEAIDEVKAGIEFASTH
jgi:outer membrane murein-binding lipoprotein Lpp